MTQRLKGKTIVIAGGAGGIGGGLSRAYASEGAAVIVGDIDLGDAENVATEIEQQGGIAVPIQLDGSSEESIRAAIDLAEQRFGGLDGFHANFASFRDGESGADLLQLPLDTFDEVMRVNARGFFLCSRLAVDAMLRRGGGSIVFTSSGAAHQPEPVRVAYAMSKAATHALMRNVAARFGPEGIRANVIAPGVVAHRRFWEVMPTEQVEQMKARIPVGRLGAPEDIAAMGVLLMSDEGSFITGQVISVDGGGSMRP